MERRIAIGGVLFFAVVGAGPVAFAETASERAKPGLQGSAKASGTAPSAPSQSDVRTSRVETRAPSQSDVGTSHAEARVPSQPDVMASGVGTAAPRRPSAAELASARRLFAEALAAEDQGRWAAALELYERVSKVAVSPSLWYHLGVCHEALGHVIEALNAFELAVSGATARGETALAKESRSRLEKLREKVAKLVLHLPDDAEGVRIEIDGEPVNPALAGAAILVTPGERRVVVKAANYSGELDTTVLAEVGAVVELKLHDDLGPKRSRTPAQPAVLARPAPAREADAGPDHLPAYVAGGATLALAAGALITGIAADNTRDVFLAKNENPAPGSLDERRSLRARGQALAITSTVLTGAAVVAGGLTAYLLWPSSTPGAASPRTAGPRAPASRAPSSASAAPWIGAEGGGIVVWGAL